MLKKRTPFNLPCTAWLLQRENHLCNPTFFQKGKIIVWILKKRSVQIIFLRTIVDYIRWNRKKRYIKTNKILKLLESKYSNSSFPISKNWKTVAFGRFFELVDISKKFLVWIWNEDARLSWESGNILLYLLFESNKDIFKIFFSKNLQQFKIKINPIQFPNCYLRMLTFVCISMKSMIMGTFQLNVWLFKYATTTFPTRYVLTTISGF